MNIQFTDLLTAIWKLNKELKNANKAELIKLNVFIMKTTKLFIQSVALFFLNDHVSKHGQKYSFLFCG